MGSQTETKRKLLCEACCCAFAQVFDLCSCPVCLLAHVLSVFLRMCCPSVLVSCPCSCHVAGAVFADAVFACAVARAVFACLAVCGVVHVFLDHVNLSVAAMCGKLWVFLRVRLWCRSFLLLWTTTFGRRCGGLQCFVLGL